MVLVSTLAVLASSWALLRLVQKHSWQTTATLVTWLEDASQRAVLLIDAKGKLARIGPRARSLFGVEGRCDPYGLDDLPVRGLRDALEAHGATKWHEGADNAKLEAWIDGRFVDVDMSLLPLKSDRGALPAFVIFGPAAKPVQAVERRVPRSSAARGRASAGALEGRRVLLAEDGPDNQLLMSYVLMGLGADLVLVEDGAEAVDLARSSRFDIILLDLNMPRLDGFEAARRIRSFSEGVVILAVSASEDASDRCIDAGFDGHLAKPLRRTHLIDAIQRIEVQRCSEPKNVIRTEAQEAPSESEWEQLLSDPDFVAMLDEFRSDLDQRVAKMSEAIAARAWTELEVLAHQLKGAAGGFGLLELSLASGRLEDELRNASNHEAVAQRCIVEIERLATDVQSRDEVSDSLTRR